MFPPMRFEEKRARGVFYLKPMNCPHHHWIFGPPAQLPRPSAADGGVRDLYRYEKSGELAGLLRVRGMCMNDAHIYCTHEQVKAEAINVMRLYRSSTTSSS